ncbi:50S ribosomal protein L15e [Candidatus Woesearchaeota archaeon]|jgi:large subunit ribosomal protein L15e|nr:50S ribosomal protein L15e [Candidatus Woesearchaeota archaeon]MBT3537654.1 50S ribosomal protein L15e [Candidatus Woesearchaeota archaeon]MBT4698088.1 50S ribosomal protein L15e [Candidatus Woesearchaeota archaeon]MBT4716679.1 50S ribosomal protein L15e [Candidatus Woesearchaeota archaeon]MBT7105323.1 50S ribosomal protein L15e [Candidatus Woesearchaeota archaeon]
MGYLKYIKDLWKKPKANMPELMKDRLIEWRQDPVTLRIEKPTRLDRARSLGYRAKQGYIVVRQKVIRGSHTRPDIKHGRRSKRSGQRKDLSISYQVIAERRANLKFKNCEVLNSYLVAKDGRYAWYEIILVDREHPSIKADKRISWVSKKKGRAVRGLTSAGRKSRGLRNKGKGAEKIRPSMRANKRTAK